MSQTTHAIINDGEQLDLTPEQAKRLLDARLIYEFDDDMTPGLYYLGSVGGTDTTFADVEAFLRTEAMA